MEWPKRARTADWVSGVLTLDGEKQFEIPELTAEIMEQLAAYHHLLNPKTGYPIPLTLKSVSIVSSRPVYTDLLSTAFFALGEDRGRELVEQLRRDSGEVIEYVAVRKDGSVGASAGASFVSMK